MITRIGKLVTVVVAVMLVASACSSKSTGGGGGGGGGGAFGEKKDATIAAEVPSFAASKGSLTIASDASYPPMEYFAPDNKTVIGADVDLGHAVAAVLGLKFNFQNVTFSAIEPGLQSGKYDLGISSFFDTKEREKTFDMVDYFNAGSAIAVPASNSASYSNLSQLCGKTIAVEAGTTELSDAQNENTKCRNASKPGITVRSFPDQNAANLAVVSGRADAVLADSEVVDYAVKNTNGKLRVAGQYLAPILYAYVVPRPKGAAHGSAPMTKALVDALRKVISDGTYAKILAKWGIQKWGISAPSVNQATS